MRFNRSAKPDEIPELNISQPATCLAAGCDRSMLPRRAFVSEELLRPGAAATVAKFLLCPEISLSPLSPVSAQSILAGKAEKGSAQSKLRDLCPGGASGQAFSQKGGSNVGADRILEVADGKLRPLLARPTFSTTTVPWAGFLMEGGEAVVDANRRRTAATMPTVYVCNRGQGTLYWMHRGESHQYDIVRGSVCISSPRYEIDEARISNPWHYLALQLDPAKFRHHAPKEADAIETSLVPFLFSEDAAIASLIMAMHAEAEAGCPSGALYAESLSLALLSYLTGKHTDRQPSNDKTQLSPARSAASSSSSRRTWTKTWP